MQLSDSLQPLTCGREFGDCLVAGMTFLELQAALLKEVTGGEEIILAENAWISPEELTCLLHTSPPTLVIGDEVVAKVASSSDERIDVSESGVLIRYPWDFLTLQERVLGRLKESRVEGDVHGQATVDGIVVLGKGSRVLPGVYIEGVAVIGRDCKIGPNAYLRGMNMIGDGCHIGQAVEVKNSILYHNTEMGHLSYCGDSVVGSGVNFGAGTIVSNFRHDGKNHRSTVGDGLVDTGRRKFGAIFGDGVHTGIHTSIYPGRKLWPQTSTLPGDIVQKDLHSS
ncbi:MAG: hypothetical protein L7V86_09740 [Verrucomicrobiales bacterium]|jgi:bifunctional UDP-N-acetylglucosamine pyrophosphorylase/glucosamine-1-phosphate N-acetyltransferase|nr:hypothetical protein [Verrucomicrobiales bacterium]NCF85596.1 hypothetical protein [Verrucomicrobiaceae bacterium]